jgi:hypothetical protein
MQQKLNVCQKDQAVMYQKVCFFFTLKKYKLFNINTWCLYSMTFLNVVIWYNQTNKHKTWMKKKSLFFFFIIIYAFNIKSISY